MEHPAFVEAGEEAGIKIWTIDNFEPVAITDGSYGKFYNGDAYIVLKTTGDDTTRKSWDVHFWLGAKSSQDKQGTAAILTVTLDDMLEGKAVQHREVQAHESEQFLAYFKPAVRYVEGGLPSGFNEVVTNAGAEKRLLQLTGCDNMRIEEVPADISSLSRSNCFILEVDHDIFVLIPDGIKATHKRKIIAVANNLRDNDHNGRATIEIIDEFSSADDFKLFFDALGSGSQDDIADVVSDDQAYSREGTAVYLYQVTGFGGDLVLTIVNKPFKQKQLASEDVYILDSPNSGIFIWIGSEVDSEIKKNYHETAQQYLDMKGYPTWLHVTKISQGFESSAFKQHFQTWDNITTFSDTDAGYESSDAAELELTAKLIGKSAAARGYMPDQGAGNLLIYRLEEGTLEEKYNSADGSNEGFGALFQSEVYVVKYTYEDNVESTIIYVWLGQDASAEEKTTAFEQANAMDDELDNSAVIKVPQGKEPKHFLQIFNGNLIVVYGGKDSDYKETNFNKNYDENGIRLFRVEGTELGVDMRAVQVPEDATSLEDDDVFVLETSSNFYVWKGKESSDKEQEAALAFLQNIVKDEKEIIEIEQGDEPEEFWDILGGAAEENDDNSGWRKLVNQRVNAATTLTTVSVSVTGKVSLEKIAGFTQEDLSDDGVSILDRGEEVYYWKGANTPERVKMAKNTIIETYLNNDALERDTDNTILVTVRQGQEPTVFKNMFPSWDPDMWTNLASYEDLKAETIAANSK